MKEDIIMMEQWCTADVFITNNKKEDTKMNTPKKAKLTLDEAMTIINNASTENKIEITSVGQTNYVIKIDDTNYIVYIPDDVRVSFYIKDMLNKLHLNKSDTYNFTFVSKSPDALWGAELDNYTIIDDDFYKVCYGLNINIDILYNMVDTPNKIELDDKKLRNMLTKARFTGCLYNLFGGYGYTINNNNIIWYIPDDIDFDTNKLYSIMLDAYYDDREGILNHLDRDQIDKTDNEDYDNEIKLNIHVVSNKKVFDTDFIILINDVNEHQKMLAYMHII